MKSKIIDFSNLKEILLEVWSLVVALPLALAFGVQSGMGRQLVYMEQSW
jgi:hypothetical protein